MNKKQANTYSNILYIYINNGIEAVKKLMEENGQAEYLRRHCHYNKTINFIEKSLRREKERLGFN